MFVFGFNSLALAQSFPDTKNHWANSSIDYCVSKEYVTGYPDGTFKPDNDVTVAESYSLLNRIFQAKPNGNYLFTREKALALDAGKEAYDQLGLPEADNLRNTCLELVRETIILDESKINEMNGLIQNLAIKLVVSGKANSVEELINDYGIPIYIAEYTNIRNNTLPETNKYELLSKIDFANNQTEHWGYKDYFNIYPYVLMAYKGDILALDSKMSREDLFKLIDAILLNTKENYKQQASGKGALGEEWLNRLYSTQIVVGEKRADGSTDFKLNDTISRAEIVTLLVKLEKF